MLTVNYIPQRNDKDCSLTSAAMILGIDYEEAEKVLGDIRDPNLFDQHFEAMMMQKGYEQIKDQRKMLSGKPYADIHHVVVRVSEMNKNAHSCVMLSDGSILDPNPAVGPTPRSIEDYYKIEEVIGFRKKQ